MRFVRLGQLGQEFMDVVQRSASSTTLGNRASHMECFQCARGP